MISAKNGTGLEDLKDAIEQVLRNGKIYLEKTFSYNDAGQISLIRKYGELISEEYTEEGIAVKAYAPVEILDKIKQNTH